MKRYFYILICSFLTLKLMLSTLIISLSMKQDRRPDRPRPLRKDRPHHVR